MTRRTMAILNFRRPDPTCQPNRLVHHPSPISVLAAHRDKAAAASNEIAKLYLADVETLKRAGALPHDLNISARVDHGRPCPALLVSVIACPTRITWSQASSAGEEDAVIQALRELAAPYLETGPTPRYAMVIDATEAIKRQSHGSSAEAPPWRPVMASDLR